MVPCTKQCVVSVLRRHSARFGQLYRSHNCPGTLCSCLQHFIVGINKAECEGMRTILTPPSSCPLTPFTCLPPPSGETVLSRTHFKALCVCVRASAARVHVRVKRPKAIYSNCSGERGEIPLSNWQRIFNKVKFPWSIIVSI